MSIYTDPMVVQTEIDRRFELAGVDLRPTTHNHASHVRDLPARPLGAHPLAAFVARLVGGSLDADADALQGAPPPWPAGPRHP